MEKPIGQLMMRTTRIKNRENVQNFINNLQNQT